MSWILLSTGMLGVFVGAIVSLSPGNLLYGFPTVLLGLTILFLDVEEERRKLIN